MTQLSTKALLIVILALQSLFVKAQCDPRDKTPVKVNSIAGSLVTCPQNGTITLNGVTGGGGEYVYEIFYGPILRGIQSQPVFAALMAGKYRVRVTGCNGNFFESDTITVGNFYLEPPAHSVAFLSNESFKCNNITDGRALVTVNLTLPTGEYADTQFYKLPLYYQVSTNGDPATGFLSSPMLPFRQYLATVSGRGNTRQFLITDTISGLTPATTYYVRVTDGCGVFKTSSVSIPNLAPSPAYTYNFQVREPFMISTVWPNVKGNCVQWGELTILSSGAAVNSITANNTFAPITAVLKRQDNGQVIETKQYQSGALFKGSPSGSVNNLIFDTIPRVPVTLELTDKCGNVTVINASTPSPKVPFRVQASSICVGANAGFRVDTYNAAPSLPMRLKVYDNSNALLIDRTLRINYLYIYIANPSATFDLSAVSFVPSFGEYRIVMEDQCGISDSLVYNFQPGGGGGSPTPTFTFSPYNPSCSYADGVVRYLVDVVQTNISPVMSVLITSGPGGLTYPRTVANYRSFINISTTGYTSTPGMYFDSLFAGTYNVLITYGCGQQTTTSFTISSALVAPTSGYLNFDVGTASPCSSASTVPVRGSGNVVSPPISNIIDPPSVRILAAPIEFLRTVSISKNGSDPALPFDLGYFSAGSIAANGIDTTVLQVYPRFPYISLTSGMGYPPGNYTYQLYTKCTGVILDTKSFTVGSIVPYGKPNLGASSGYICSGGEIKVVASPIGGRRPFIYQIKRADDPDDRNYSAYQSDSIFILPASTPAGTVYIMRAVDACNNSFVGRVVVNSFTSRLYVSFSNDCIGDPTRVLTGYIPGATYRWTKPDGSVIITNSNELYIPVFQLSDIGTYTVDVNALDGCISQGAASIIGSRCYVVLAVSFTEFTARKKSSNLVNLQWKMDREHDIHHYEIERSQDGISWTTIATRPVDGGGYNTMDDQLANALAPVLFYRVKAVDATGKAVYSKTEKVYFNQSFSVTKVYPSPFTQSLSIDFMSETNDKCLVQLFDVEGREVSRSVMPVSKGINHYQYSPVLPIDAGQYTLSIIQGGNHYSTKVVKMK